MGNKFIEEGKNLSDNEIISRICENDYSCVQVLIDRYMPVVVSSAKVYSVSPLENEELISEGVLAIFKAAKSFDPEKAKFSTFVTLCIKRAMSDEIKSALRSKRIPQSMISSIDGMEIESGDSPEDIVISRENLNEFKDIIKKELSDTELKVLSLFLEGKTYADISEELNISLKSVDNALSRVRNKLR